VRTRRGLTDPDRLRKAAAHQRIRSTLREVRRVAADKRDREEMRIVREQLARLAPAPWDQTSNSA
jgi:hypothetical protein